MDILKENISWMLVNVILAALGVIFGWMFLNEKRSIFKIALFLLWFAFVPNTIYLVTDIQYLGKQLFSVQPLIQIILILQYTVLMFLAITTYVYALYPFEKFLHSKFKKNSVLINYVLIITNFLIAFGVALGKIQRTQSWYVFTEPQRVLYDGFQAYDSSTQMMFVIIFGILINILYFGIRSTVLKLKL
ncbi:MAG: hypothetical protein A2857_05110 [Candidatus Levybacteria bacterium RIFCSPHIGHO2_01_FULL_36_15]|nr:MAG: hypothetical protein A2857_05110 [Candidatus Levybacteria bacterium RIFCSPHIGHO2_01_FULL_36_15]OGH37223.1 MAG: hypothetical protein A2905_05970 [Candidatus Levybacteria bacterium RIFCSPLOWO2_01_FULL_36_10]